jgi:hypothetical protein
MTHQVQHDVLTTFTYDVLRQSCSSRRHRASHRRLNDENLAASVTHPFTCFPNETRSAIDCDFCVAELAGMSIHVTNARPNIWRSYCRGCRRQSVVDVTRRTSHFARCSIFVHDATRCDTPIGAHSGTLEAPGDRSILRECSFRARASKRVRHGEGPQRQENNTENGKHSDVREHRAERYAVDGDLPHRA